MCTLGCEFHLEVFQLDLQVPFMVHVFLRQEDGVAVVAGLPENLDGDLNVEVDLAFAALFKTAWDNSRFVIYSHHYLTQS